MTRTAGKRGGKLFALQSKPSDGMMLSPRISETFIPAKYVRSLVWSDDSLVDRVGGMQFITSMAHASTAA